MGCKDNVIKRGKKGLSPVVATVLLISIVIAIAIIVFFWLRGFTQSAIEKGNENIKMVCQDVDFDPDYSGGRLSISNTASANVPIYDMKLRVMSQGTETTKKLSKISNNWPEVGLTPGDRYSGDISNSIPENPESFELVPVLVGTSEDGQKQYPCEEAERTLI